MNKHRRYSPTALTTFSRCCPAAMAFYWQRREEDKKNQYKISGNDYLTFGSAFHYIVYQAALAIKKGTDAAKAVEAATIGLSTQLPPDVVSEASEHAKAFISYWEFPKQFDYEHGMAFDAQWNKVEWDSPLGKLRLIFDAVGMINYQDGEYEYKIAMGQDYKTGWACKQDDVESTQMDAYVFVLDTLYGKTADGIAVEIVSTRLHRAFTKMYFYNNADHVEEIAVRKKRFLNLISAAELSDLSPRVGYGCIKCDYAGRCEAFGDAVTKALSGVFAPTPEGMKNAAMAYIALTRRLEYATDSLKEYCKEHGHVEVDGNLLGYFEKSRRELTDPRNILEVWFKATKLELPKEQLDSLATLFGIMEPSVSAWEKVVKKCAKPLGFKTQKAAVEEFGSTHLAVKNTAQFGWKKEEESEDE